MRAASIRPRLVGLALLGCTSLVVACAPSRPSSVDTGAARPQNQVVGPKRLAAAINGNPTTLGPQGNPLPRHLLEDAARDDKAGFLQLPYWTEAYVGTGAFKLREWLPGERVLVEANDAYVPRPRIDQIEIKLIADGNVFVSTLLAGTIEMGLGQTISIDQALTTRAQWQQGRVEIALREGWTVLYPQGTYTSPTIIGDVRFRRALMHAIDRKEMVDTLVYGLSSVADSLIQLDRPEYASVSPRPPRYEYDPAKTAQMLQDLGYARGVDRSYADASGQPLKVEIRTAGANDNNVKAAQSVADYWQRIGLTTDLVLVPRQQTDLEYLATFPGFLMGKNTADESYFVNYTTAKVATRANSWTGSASGYHNAGYDALYAQYARAIPTTERLALIGQMNYHLAFQLAAMGMFYDNLIALIGNRVTNVVVPQSYDPRFVWSAYQWDLNP